MTKEVFKTKKPDAVFLSIFSSLNFTFLALTLFLFGEEGFSRDFALLFSLTAMLIIWQLLSIYALKVVIDAEQLRVKMFFKLYWVPLADIQKIRCGETMWSGLHKYGTAAKGLILFAKNKNDLYITPADDARFLEALLARNPSITVEKI